VRREELIVRPQSSTCALGVIVIVLTLAVPAATQVKLPADFTFERGKDSPGLVTFSHEQHKAKAEKCQACHVKVFKMKKGTTGVLTMEKMKAGEQCGACHNGKTELGGSTVFAVADDANCVKCHKK
jgi:c(7)-type cytochrome triheme protein